jgi:hypothetical protein|tara:strand:+ start:684 stop:905 length:222 start_codon:yes stop_codon:yes gene_type:complete
MTEEVQSVLDEVGQSDLEAIITIGVEKDGKIQLRSSANNVAVMHWLLNKGLFELNIFEMNQKQGDPPTATISE